jgi:hypothetical protein
MNAQRIIKHLVVSVALSLASAAESDVVTDWNDASLEAISIGQHRLGFRALAILRLRFITQSTASAEAPGHLCKGKGQLRRKRCGECGRSKVLVFSPVERGGVHELHTDGPNSTAQREGA